MVISTNLVNLLMNQDTELVDKLNEADVSIDYLCIPAEDDSKLSYIPKSKLDLFDMDYWNEEKRSKWAVIAKPSKVMRKIFPEMDEKELTRFASMFHAVTSIESKFDDFEETYDIAHWYSEDRHATGYHGDGSLGSSCMRYDDCQQYLEFYEALGNVRLLILKECGGVKARALLWENIYFPHLGERKTFMDRIYTFDSRDEDLFIEYAIKKGYVYKSDQSFSHKDGFKFNREYFSDKIKTDFVQCDYYPYMDTMSYSDGETFLTNDSEHEDITMEFEDTGGEYIIIDYEYSEYFDRNFRHYNYSQLMNDYLPDNLEEHCEGITVMHGNEYIRRRSEVPLEWFLENYSEDDYIIVDGVYMMNNIVATTWSGEKCHIKDTIMAIRNGESVVAKKDECVYWESINKYYVIDCDELKSATANGEIDIISVYGYSTAKVVVDVHKPVESDTSTTASATTDDSIDGCMCDYCREARRNAELNVF